jgi:hypothetical protein
MSFGVLMWRAGNFTHYPAGFIASVLFLVPGFPLIARYSIYCNTKLSPR